MSFTPFVLLCGLLVGTPACGFGTYNDSAAPQAVSASSGVWDAGQWWPWACALDGGTFTNPSPQSTPVSYTASGTCGAGGAFAVSVNGCEMDGNWDALGLSDVTTTIPSSIPKAGGWEVTGTGAASAVWTCDASRAGASDDLTFTCTAAGAAPDAGPTAACESTLKAAN